MKLGLEVGACRKDDHAFFSLVNDVDFTVGIHRQFSGIKEIRIREAGDEIAAAAITENLNAARGIARNEYIAVAGVDGNIGDGCVVLAGARNPCGAKLK